MNEDRPNPDALLAAFRSEHRNDGRGSLRIFFGYAPGVGKTFSMLQTAHRAIEAGRDVVVGYVERHARPETLALLNGIESLPVREALHQGIQLSEFDLDGALQRRPELLLVDELAHSNAEGSRHAKRWQDIDEVLAAGINVWTTLNVQHIESLNDIIGQITGVVVRETIPDHVFESADELELVDITPDELLERLNGGKIYLPEQAQKALLGFFQRSNLSALREMSLRRAASRVHYDVESERQLRSDAKPWATTERFLVCVGPSPSTARVIRTAKRMAVALEAQWVAMSVDVPGKQLDRVAAARVAQHFRLAERLGAETVTLCDENIAKSVLDYARSRNVTKIFIGKPLQSRWKQLVSRSVVDQLLDASREIDVYIIQGGAEPEESLSAEHHATAWIPGIVLAKIIAVTVLSGLVAALMSSVIAASPEANSAMIFLAGIAFVAFRYGRVPAIVSTVLAVLAFDFFFVPPFYTFAVSDTQYVVTFGVMLSIGILISTLASRLRFQLTHSRRRELRTNALYDLGKQLCAITGRDFLVAAACTKLAELVHGEVAAFLLNAADDIEVVYGSGGVIASHSLSIPVANWVIAHEQIAGCETNTLPNANASYFPVLGANGCLGAIAIRAHGNPARIVAPEQRQLIDACINQLALAIERDQLVIDAADARVQMEAEQLRSTLLSSVSHDLKTPLAAIAGASSTLLANSKLDDVSRVQMLETVANEATRLNRLLENILQMSKLASGVVTPNLQWHVLEEIVGSAINRTQRDLQDHIITTQLADDLPLIHVDGILIEQLLINLLENAAKYTPRGSHLWIGAAMDASQLILSVCDDGPGVPKGEEKRIFEKFYRSSNMPDDGRGSGLGLAICRAIAKVHNGTIEACPATDRALPPKFENGAIQDSRQNVNGSGLCVTVRLPTPTETPVVPNDRISQ